MYHIRVWCICMPIQDPVSMLSKLSRCHAVFLVTMSVCAANLVHSKGAATNGDIGCCF